VIILDPFCGSGTTLQEALLLGYNNLIASDKNPKAINNTQNNLNWLASKYGLNTNNVQLLTLPIEHLARAIKPSSIDAIITEPYLGPALKGNEGLKQINLIIKELETFYLSAFNVFTKILKSQGKMVLIFPIFRYNNSNLKLAILDRIEKLGFKILNKEDLIYFRPKQFIWREILILEKE
jgi:tRNA G10  N-methylase Trm11